MDGEFLLVVQVLQQLLVCMNVTVLHDAVLVSVSLLACVAWLLVLLLMLDGFPAAG